MYLLKHDKRAFDEKQLQIYMFGSLVTGMLFSVDYYRKHPTTTTKLLQVTGSPSTIHGLILATITFSVVGGIVVAIIIKKLDNIVKLYAQAVSGAITAMSCAILFPEVFQFDVMYIVSFTLTIVAIYLYEAPDPWCQRRMKGVVDDGTG
ncbi:hypothetical protein LSH36_640g01096 [Paralvinella palmiformis]|uniref:Uncharacterized protein n=1 Tax=Paralvinella palmiformis TaxID=53620 RepID=A0AAD9J4K0_9ANNE|nr:hypothetical protein LSH36_640g01096 [Paralvinella palmiformis]